MITKINERWTDVDGRMVYTAGSPAVILTSDESRIFVYDDVLQAECAAAAKACGLRGLIPCHTIGGYTPGTVIV